MCKYMQLASNMCQHAKCVLANLAYYVDIIICICNYNLHIFNYTIGATVPSNVYCLGCFDF